MFFNLSGSDYVITVFFLLIVEILLVYKLSRVSGFGKMQKRVFTMLAVCISAALSDVLCVIFQGSAGRPATFALNAVFDISFALSAFCLFYYSEQAYGSRVFKRRCTAALAALPLALLSVMLLCSYRTGWIISVDGDGNYSRGKYYYVFFFMLAYIYVGAVLAHNACRMIKNRNKDRKKYATAWQSILYVIPVIAGTLIQLHLTELPCSNMGLMIMMVMIYIDSRERLIDDGAAERKKDEQILVSLCAEFIDVYYTDLERDTLEIIKEDTDSNGAKSALNSDSRRYVYSERLKDYYENYVIKETASDFLENMMPEDLMKRLENEDRFIYRFKVIKNTAGQEYFEMQATKLYTDDPGFRVVIGFRAIDDIVNEERARQHELQKALDDANTNNEIISSIGRIYSLIYRIDLKNNFIEQVSSDENIHRLNGISGAADELLNDACDMLISDEYRERMRAFFDLDTLPERMKDSETIVTEYKAYNGDWYHTRFIEKKRDENGVLTNVLLVASIVNAQKQKEIEYQRQLQAAAEEAKRADRAKTGFLRRMSHDIRTPINGILGMAEIGKRCVNDPERVSDCLKKITGASDFLLELVNEVLDMSKLESGEVSLENSPFDIVDLIEDAQAVISVQAAENGLRFIDAGCDVEHRHLKGSPLHLRQILQNIMGNALKYNKENGSITVGCRETGFDGTSAVYEFVCSDTGIGMSEEFQKKAFEPFAQENDTARTNYVGTGLGLAIVKELIERMGGTITLKSKKGEGTTFTIRMRFDIDADYHEDVSDSSEGDISISGMKILLVEDNDLNMEIAEYMLRDEGALVTEAWNGREALDIYTASVPDEYDVILMDIMMPVMNGLDAARAIRASGRPDARTIPIIAMTANAFMDDVSRSRAAGMNGHISKPLNISEFIKTVKKYAAGHRVK